MAKNTKIEWTDITWNLVWGCKGGCDYCYARKYARRFGKKMGRACGYPDDLCEDIANFHPTIISTSLNPKFPKEPKRIFVNSMSDIAFWADSWIMKLIEIIEDHPQHTFQVLTKFPKLVAEKTVYFPKNTMLGLTVTKQGDFKDIKYLKDFGNPLFISAEPIRERLSLFTCYRQFTYLHEIIDWIIIGCETGQGRKSIDNGIIEDLIDQAFLNDIPVFVKQMEINGKIVKDDLPREFNFKQFPK